MLPTPTSNQCVKIVDLLAKENPKLVEDAVKRIEKPEPYYIYLGTAREVFAKFLEIRGLGKKQIQGVHISRQLVQERTLFISVILILYSPAVYNTNTSYAIENGVRHELEGMLLCNKEWVSQQVPKIAFDYSKNYQEFKGIIDELLIRIKSEIKEDQPEPERVNEAVGLFQ
jgi:hypothetical protein